MTKIGSPVTTEDQSKIAALIVKLSSDVLSPKVTRRYIALKVDDGPNSDAVNVYANHVRCFIQSTDILERAKKAQLSLELTNQNVQRNKHWFRIKGLLPSDIEANENLFKDIVKESVDTVIDRKKEK